MCVSCLQVAVPKRGRPGADDTHSFKRLDYVLSADKEKSLMSTMTGPFAQGFLSCKLIGSKLLLVSLQTWILLTPFVFEFSLRIFAVMPTVKAENTIPRPPRSCPFWLQRPEGKERCAICFYPRVTGVGQGYNLLSGLNILESHPPLNSHPTWLVFAVLFCFQNALWVEQTAG